VRDVRCHPPDGGEALRANQALLALLDRVRHRVEVARQIADLVVGGYARPLRVVALAQLTGVRAQHRQRPQRREREQKHRTRDQEPADAQRDRHPQRRLAVVGQTLRDLRALAAQRPPHPVQVVRQRREVTLELGARLRIDSGGRRPELARHAVQLGPQRRNLLPPIFEIRSPGRTRFLFQVAIDHAQRIVQVLAPHAQRERQIGVEARRRTAPERGREVVQRLPGRVDRPL